MAKGSHTSQLQKTYYAQMNDPNTKEGLGSRRISSTVLEERNMSIPMFRRKKISIDDEN